jgi:hypothetical protein
VTVEPYDWNLLAQSAGANRKSRFILVLDDSPSMPALIRACLPNADWEMVCATYAAGALSQTRSFHTSKKSFHHASQSEECRRPAKALSSQRKRYPSFASAAP